MAKNKKNITTNEGVEHVSLFPRTKEEEERKKEIRKRAEEMREKMRDSGTLEQIVITSDNVAKPVSKLTNTEKNVEIAKCATDPIYFIETFLTIFDQTKNDGEGQIVPFKLFKFQKYLISCYQKYKKNIANKYRQAGISTATSAYIAWYICFNENRTVAIAADKLTTARDEMMRDVVEFINSCPDWLVPKALKENAEHRIYDNGSEVRAFASSTLRGYTPTLIFWDETAWSQTGEKFWTAARPSLQTGGRAIFVSTPNGLDPIFYKTFEAARKGESDFHAVELWWFNDPRYITDKNGKLDLVWIKNKGKKNEERMVDEEFSEEKRIELHHSGWEATSSWFESQVRDYNGDMKKLAQELLCSFLGSGDNFISEEYMKRIDDEEIRAPIRQECNDNNMWIFEDPEPEQLYIQTIDVSSGHGEDYSTINILKVEEELIIKKILKDGVPKENKIRKHKLTQVAEYYAKLKPNQLGEIAYTYGKTYNNAYTIIDVTNGYGAITLEKLIELGFDNLHYSEISHKPTRDRLNGYIKVGQKTLPDGKISKVDLIPGFFIGGNRGAILIEFQRSINMGDLVIRSQRLSQELKTFVTVNGNRVADHKRSFHDDSIMSTAMGVYTIFHELFKIGESKERAKKILDAFMMLSGDEIIEKVKRPNKDNSNTRTPDYRVSKKNPYGANSWLFKGLDKRK